MLIKSYKTVKLFKIKFTYKTDLQSHYNKYEVSKIIYDRNITGTNVQNVLNGNITRVQIHAATIHALINTCHILKRYSQSSDPQISIII